MPERLTQEATELGSALLSLHGHGGNPEKFSFLLFQSLIHLSGRLHGGISETLVQKALAQIISLNHDRQRLRESMTVSQAQLTLLPWAA